MCMIFKAAFSAMTTFFFCALKFKNQPGSLMVHMLKKEKNLSCQELFMFSG